LNITLDIIIRKSYYIQMGKTQKILIIEDNKDICELIEMILSDKYDVEFRTEIEDVLKNFDMSSYDLVISDYLIGNRSAEAIVEKFPKKRYVIITALSTQNPHLKKLVSLPNISYMQKPFELSDFTNLVDSIINSK